ncbi:MAG: NAD(P)-binding domain-containing protein, partial [Alphaproteobacteria bacterium]
MNFPSIAVVGGTGNLGAAIAWRLARAGYPVVIGSRSADGAQKTAAELGHGLSGATNIDAAAGADIVIVT